MWRSDAQRQWGHSAEGTRALGGSDKVHEWDEATKRAKDKDPIRAALKRCSEGLVPT